MSHILSEQDIEKLASLSRLTLNSFERQKIAAELESVLNYVEQLQKLDTKQVKTFSDQYAQQARPRIDENQPWPETNLLPARSMEDGLLSVKNIFDRHES